MEKVISALVQGGKATTGPPLGPQLGPMGINAGKVVAEINEKTKEFAGMTIPVKVIVNPITKEYRIEIGSPSISALIKKEIGLEKASGKAAEEKVGDLTIDQIIKIAKMKESASLATNPQKAVKEVLGTCVSMGILVDGRDARELQKEVDEGKYEDKISGKTALEELSKEEIAKKQAVFREAIEKRKAEEAAKVAAVPEAAEEKVPEKKLSKKAIRAAAALEKKVEAAAEAAEMAAVGEEAKEKTEKKKKKKGGK